MSDLIERLREALAPHYEVERELGSGGMGTVFLARDTVLDRKVAVKVVRSEQTSLTATDRLLQEARILASLSHPNIVPIHSAGEFDGCFYFIMDYIEGETLDQRLKRGPLSSEEAIRLADDLLAALHEAHKRGVVHRDVKPKNVFLVEGRALLVDFGVAKRMEPSAPPVTAPGRPVGTPGYMAPEQYLGEEVTGATDIYAVGMTVYEALTCRQWAILQTAEEISWSGVPIMLIPALGRALEWSPGERWPDAAAFRRALKRAEPWTRRRKLATTVVGGVAAALLLGTAAWIVFRDTAGPLTAYAVEDPRQSYLILPFVVTTDDPALDWLARGGAHMLTSDLESWREIRVVDRRRLDALAAARSISLDEPVDLDDALQLARDARVGTLVLGEALVHAGEAEIVVRLYDVAEREELRDPERAAGPAAEVWSMFDRIAASILELAGAKDVTPDLGAKTTTSLQAYQEYLRGLQHLYRFELDQATRAFLSALAHDSTFALAYYRLATALSWNREAAVHASEAAVRHSEGLTPRERDHILAFNAFQHDNFELAREMYQELLAADSSDAEAWYYLGEVEFKDHRPLQSADGSVRPHGDWNLALRAYMRAVELDATFHLGYGNAFQIYRLTASGACGVRWADTLSFCPRWRDSVVWVQADTPDVVDSAYVAAVAPALSREAIAIAQQWANAAPDEQRPHAELRDLYLQRRRQITLWSTDEDVSTYSRLALDAERARARLTADTMPEEMIRLGLLYLANGVYDTAAVLADTAVTRLRSVGRLTPLQAANLYVARGQPDRALALLAQHDSALLADTSRVAAGERDMRRRLLHRIGILGSTGADRSSLRGAVDSLRAALSEAEFLPEEIARFVAAGMTSLGPGLLALGPQQARVWLNLLESIPASWRAYLEATADSAEAAQDAVAEFLQWMEDNAGAITPLDLYAVSTAAGVMGRDSLVIDLAILLDVQPYAIERMDPAWGLLSLSYLTRARSYEALADTAKALRYYRRFVTAWGDAEPDLKLMTAEAQRALTRLTLTPSGSGDSNPRE
ncbi:MAG: protein kinase [Gemmatimonadota bacterium]|nr:MAG: protein kinase [Gemmatimonadota bacterium]